MNFSLSVNEMQMKYHIMALTLFVCVWGRGVHLVRILLNAHFSQCMINSFATQGLFAKVVKIIPENPAKTFDSCVLNRVMESL